MLTVVLRKLDLREAFEYPFDAYKLLELMLPSVLQSLMMFLNECVDSLKELCAFVK